MQDTIRRLSEARERLPQSRIKAREDRNRQERGRHLDELSRSMGMAPSAYDNAKRRLRTRLQRLLERFGWTPTDLLYGETDVDQVG